MQNTWVSKFQHDVDHNIIYYLYENKLSRLIILCICSKQNSLDAMIRWVPDVVQTDLYHLLIYNCRTGNVREEVRKKVVACVIVFQLTPSHARIFISCRTVPRPKASRFLCDENIRNSFRSSSVSE